MRRFSIRMITSAAVATAMLTVTAYTGILAHRDWRYWASIMARRTARPAAVNQSTILARSRYSEILFGIDNTSSRPAAPILFLVVAGDCELCEETIAKWADALEAPAAPENLVVRAAVPRGTTREAPIVGALARAFGKRLSVVLAIADLERFRCTTGIATVPTSLVFVDETSLVGVMFGTVSERGIELTLRRIADGSRDSTVGLYSERHSGGRAIVDLP